MWHDANQLMRWATSLSVFVLVAALWTILVIAWALRSLRARKRVRNRLGTNPPAESSQKTLQLWHDGCPQPLIVPSDAQPQRLASIRLALGVEGSLLKVFLGLAGAMAAAFFVVTVLSNRTLAGAISALAVAWAFWTIIRHRLTRRQTLFERQFVDAMGLAARSLRAGHPLAGSFQLIADEIDAPVGELFGDICQQQAMGTSLERAVQNASARSSNDDLKLFATSIVIQMHSGGNLADMMDRLAQIIQERIRLNRRVRVLTAQTQFSKRILLALPVALFIVLNLLSPAYMQPLYITTPGHIILAAGGAGLLTGAWMMNRMVVLKY